VSAARAFPADVPSRPISVVSVPLRQIAAAVGARALEPDAGRPVSQQAGPLPHRVSGVTLDSRAVFPGDLYAALPGEHRHGAAFTAQAAAAGAVGVLTDPAGADLARGSGLVVLEVDDPRRCLGEVSALVYGHPAEGLCLVGVTGTQGKTTVVHLAEAGAVAAGRVVGRIGTTGAAVAGSAVGSRLTTPEAPELQALLAVMRERGVDTCVMEVSSHSLVKGRVDGVTFDLAVFTNLGRDHLDFHADMESYFAAKAELFTPRRARRALVNADDPYGRRLIAGCPIPVSTFSASGAAADWRAVELRLDAGGSPFTVVAPDGSRHPARVGLPGAFNVANALAAIAALAEAGLDLGQVISGVASTALVPGRMEPIRAGQQFLVVVDYAHKPEAVKAALGAIRPLTSGRVMVVLGAGGERDSGKRAMMGAVAARLADLVVVTDDNPRSEDPARIRAAILQGTREVSAGQRAEVREVPDRRAAIAEVISLAQPGDSVLIAGKGHEQGQEVAGQVEPFDDRVIARALLESAGAGVHR
jgi:UDP-N-acetylmuramoyl-L-alanyl-D-glutamate--2,6-diaminopimelate ligase